MVAWYNGDMRRRLLRGWRMWAVFVLTTLGFFSVMLPLANISSSHGSRWDVPWTVIAWLVVGGTLFVWLGTFLSRKMKH